MTDVEIRTVDVVQYLQPLREGGSLPAIVKADDDILYVIKFRGAGQGAKALIAELIGGLLAKTIGLKVPELVFMNLDNSFGQTEPDEEIQDLLKFSVGLNLGLHYLSSAITYDPLVSIADSLTASKVVLLDSMISNIDRTTRNTNLLNWNKELWLIDHGASLYFHHHWASWDGHLDRTFPKVKDHVLLDRASELDQAAIEIKSLINKNVIDLVIEQIPQEWLEDKDDTLDAVAKRHAYASFLKSRLDKIDQLVEEAKDAR